MRIVEKIISLSRMWNDTTSPQEQAYIRKQATEEFNFICDQAVQIFGLQVTERYSVIHAHVTDDPNEDAYHYGQVFERAVLRGSAQAMDYFQALLDHQLPAPRPAWPVVTPATELRHALILQWHKADHSILVACPQCQGACIVRVLSALEQESVSYVAEYAFPCPHCRHMIEANTRLIMLA